VPDTPRAGNRGAAPGQTLPLQGGHAARAGRGGRHGWPRRALGAAPSAAPWPAAPSRGVGHAARGRGG
jgi:hypothetical protein